jgi:hypothetical protein
MRIKITASEDEIVNYLNKLWYNNYINNNNILYNIFTYISNIYYKFINKYNTSNMKNNIPNLKKIGISIYNDATINNEQQINNKIKNKHLNNIIMFKNSNYYNRINIIKKYGMSYIFYKHKKGSTDDCNNFRYYINHHNIIKILDRLWYQEIILHSNYLPDSNIFKVKLTKDSQIENLIDIAKNNTLSTDNVLLLDLIKAYDSVEYDILEDLLLSNLKRKMNIMYATELFEQYMIIIKNRTIIYNKTKINVLKSIPTGLPSSCLVFTYIMDEIIYRFLNDNKHNFLINIDFIINIYFDDIYVKILDISKTYLIIDSLINILNKYKFKISYDKSKISKTLNYNKFQELVETDLYLGIPFTRDINTYMKIILNECNNKKKFNYTWNNIYHILVNNLEHKQILLGYLNYKLKPILNNMDIIDFIHSFINN